MYFSGPATRHGRFTNKPDSFDPRDICRGHRAKRPASQGFKTRRIVNPLMPAYKLPGYRSAPVPSPKFFRDSMNWQDVTNEMTATQRRIKAYEMNPGHQERHIQQDQPHKQQSRFRKQGRKPARLPVDAGKWSSSRVVNPLQPQYHMNFMSSGDIPQSTPKKQGARYLRSFSLETRDIPGAQADTKRRRRTMLQPYTLG